MNHRAFSSFGDELTKIAVFKALGNAFKNALHTGWHGTGPLGSASRQTWMGQGLALPAERAAMGPLGKAWDTATSLGGATKHLPVGAKSMMLAGTALQAKDAIKGEDPTGQGRGHAERVTGVAGNAIGGMAGAGALLRTGFGRRNPLMANLIGGIGGGILGEKLTTTPWRAHRERQMAEQSRARLTPPQGEVAQ
jgi:hypothetical protein